MNYCRKHNKEFATYCLTCAMEEKASSSLAPASGSVIAAVVGEVERATKKFPTWPTDPIHALAVLQEEVGELSKEVLQLTYEPHKSSKEAVAVEAKQVAAMALRFLLSLESYEYRPGPQRSQNAPALAQAGRRETLTKEETPK